VLTTPHWAPGYILGTIFFTLALVWAPAGLAWLRHEGRVGTAAIAGTVVGIAILAVVLGRAQQVQYEEHHYTRPSLFLQDGGPQKAYTLIRAQHDKRIGISGSGEIFFGQYGYYGADLSNTVRYIGVPGPHGAYRLATTCRQFRRQINAGDYDYVVISQYTQDSPDAQYRYPIRAWTKDDPALKLVLQEPTITPQPDYVYKVLGRVNPAGCAKGGEKSKS